MLTVNSYQHFRAVNSVIAYESAECNIPEDLDLQYDKNIS